MMFNQPNMQYPQQNQNMQNQPMTNFQNTYNQPQPPQYYQYTPNWNRPVMTTQPQVQNQFNGALPGKMINNLQEVRPNEVPMDGSASIFPMNDFSSIYVKAWGPDGNIQTLKFIPDVTTNKETDQGPSEFDKIMERLEAIESLLNKTPIQMEPQQATVKRQSYQRKEVNNNVE